MPSPRELAHRDHRRRARRPVHGDPPQGAGFDDFVILEKASGVGGTWYHNRYPGCACDIPSHLYSFSFEIKRDWSRPYAPQPEILAYLEHFAEKYGAAPALPLRRRGAARALGRGGGAWTLALASGRSGRRRRRRERDRHVQRARDARHRGARLVRGHALPLGALALRTTISPARRVGVIGSAASAVQFVPEIVKQAAQRPPVPAHRELGDAEARRPLHRGAARAVPQRSRRRARAAQQDLRGRRRPDVLRARCAREDGGRLPRRIAGRADPELRAQLRPDHPVRLQAPADLERLLRRRSTARTSSSSPTRSRASRRAASSPPTAARGGSTR